MGEGVASRQSGSDSRVVFKREGSQVQFCHFAVLMLLPSYFSLLAQGMLVDRVLPQIQTLFRIIHELVDTVASSRVFHRSRNSEAMVCLLRWELQLSKPPFVGQVG